MNIGSPGGVGPSRALLEALQGVEFVGVVASFAGSAGAIILQGCRRRIMAPTAKLLLHAPAACHLGTAESMLLAARDLKYETARDIEFLHKRTGQPRRVVKRWMNGGDRYFDAQAVLAAGLVDEINEAPPV